MAALRQIIFGELDLFYYLLLLRYVNFRYKGIVTNNEKSNSCLHLFQRPRIRLQVHNLFKHWASQSFNFSL